MARCLYINTIIFQVLMCSVLINETSQYNTITLEQTKVCTLQENDEVKIKLGKGVASAKLIKQENYFDNWSGRYPFTCSFLVKAPSNYGVYAVVQYLSFRKNETTGACKDYVQFGVYPKHPLWFLRRGGSVKNIKKICGRIVASESYLSAPRQIGYRDPLRYSTVSENGYVAKDGSVHVTIYIAKEKLEPDEKLDILLAFTAFKSDCKKRDNSIKCKDCEWIWEGFKDDDVQNCPYKPCMDENFCRGIDSKNEATHKIVSETETVVSVSAVATIILVLLIFACCVWISRRLQLCCFDPSNNSQSRMEMNATNQRTQRIEDNITPYGDVLPETANPSAPPIAEDKDCPPSYSSLFPGR